MCIRDRLIYLILRKVTGVLQEGVEFAERVASGDLDRSLNIRREDELGKLARALNTMVQRLKASFSMAEELSLIHISLMP